MIRKEFETLEALDEYLATGQPLAGSVFQGLDLSDYSAVLEGARLVDCLFLGCHFEPETLAHVEESGALVFPQIPDLPFHPYRGTLYRVEELLEGYEPGVKDSYHRSLDGRIYRHYLETGGPDPPAVLETLAQRLHDHAITDALQNVIADRHVVAIMGGHAVRRDEAIYRRVARISRALVREGMLMVSGGGPGAMEASHVGAWFARRPDDDMEAAFEILAEAPYFLPEEPWLDTALAVREAFPKESVGEGEGKRQPDCVGIPTWLYGHEPPNLFADRVAKYFANSVREDGLLTIATGGVIFSPGSAGTIQEVFQDAAQNHYNTVGVISPMIFFDSGYWQWTKPVFPLLAQLAAGREYASLLSITDEPDEVVQRLVAFRDRMLE